MFEEARDDKTRRALACAGTIKLSAYLGWLRSQEIFAAEPDSVTLITPLQGPTRGLNPNLGAIELQLLTSTKSDRTETADSIIAWITLPGLEPAKWMSRLLTFPPAIPNRLFSTTTTPIWTSNHFRTNFAYPILEMQQMSGEPTLKDFSDKPGHRIMDKVYSMHSWQRPGCSRVSHGPRQNKPNPKGTRMATPTEVYERGYWQVTASSKNMPRRYNQWDLMDHIGITLFCM
jgi:hypothetical protein